VQALHNHARPYRLSSLYPNLALGVEHPAPSFGTRRDHARDFRHLLDRRQDQAPRAWLLDNVASLPMVFPGWCSASIMIFYLNFDIGIYGTIWIFHRLHHPLYAYGLRYNTHFHVADPQGARGIGGDERRLLGHDVRRVILPS